MAKKVAPVTRTASSRAKTSPKPKAGRSSATTATKARPTKSARKPAAPVAKKKAPAEPAAKKAKKPAPKAPVKPVAKTPPKLAKPVAPLLPSTVKRPALARRPESAPGTPRPVAAGAVRVASARPAPAKALTARPARPAIVPPPPAPKIPPEDALLEKAKRALNAGDEAQSERYLEQMIAEFPLDPRGRIFLGNLRLRRGDAKGALEEYQKILRKSPHEPLALWYKAQLHLAEKPNPDFGAAVASFKKIVQGHARKKDEQSRKYVEEARKQLRFCEARKLSLQSRRYLESEEPRVLKKGRDLLEKALALYPEDARNHMNLGVAYLLLNQDEKAADLCQAAIQLKPDYARAYLMLGRAQKQLQKLKHAKDAFLRCIELDRSGRDAKDAWNDRAEVERQMAKIRLTMFQALAGRPGPNGEKVRLTLGQMKQMVTMLEGDEIDGADLTLDARGSYILTAYTARHRYRVYPGPESLVIEKDGQTV